MKSVDMKPTGKNIIKSIWGDNNIQRRRSAYNFIKMLDFQSGSISIAVDGKWGTGKTFFIKQCKFILDCLNNEDPNKENFEKYKIEFEAEIEPYFQKFHYSTKIKYKTVYFDAWKNDIDIDPIVSLSKSIATTTFNIKTKAKSVAFKAGQQLVRIAVEQISKIDIGSLLDIFQTEENTEAQFKKELASLIPKDGRLVIFIDELDRCRPVYAVKLLERVQHFFDNEKITFVFSVNLFELKNTIQKLYGSNFNGDRYLDRFFDFVMEVPEPYFESGIKNLERFGYKLNYFDYCSDLEIKYGLTYRERNHFENRVNTAIYKHVINEKNDYLKKEKFKKIDLFVIPYLIALKMVDGQKFEDFMSNKDGTDFINFLSVNKTFLKFEEIKRNEKNEAQKLYESIFSEKNDYKKHISEVLSLVSEFSEYKDEETKPTP
ncbi:P-loop NTPase fold protein [Lactobacillus sp. M0396]|uniref:KAP family P-loop NTPase fold protein n=1 Tax=Lactobacillus sp. M0396 TaxID=2751030 RepID=UPI0018DC94F3|nr:P-loop NTPase fold protein [Lactobacillus sp. M0396]MBI0033438.1 hypothetical protein [Lactobacillus sp. M0396]